VSEPYGQVYQNRTFGNNWLLGFRIRLLNSNAL
jgi:hypothetical protein